VEKLHSPSSGSGVPSGFQVPPSQAQHVDAPLPESMHLSQSSTVTGVTGGRALAAPVPTKAIPVSTPAAAMNCPKRMTRLVVMVFSLRVVYGCLEGNTAGWTGASVIAQKPQSTSEMGRNCYPHGK
jgi:hypothetical protein